MHFIGSLLIIALGFAIAFFVARKKVRRFFEEGGSTVDKLVYDPDLLKDGLVFTVYYTDNAGSKRSATAKVGYLFFVSDVSIVEDQADDQI